MKRAYGLDVPESVEEAIDSSTCTALLVYDMQVGILRQLRHGGEITAKVADVLARGQGGWTSDLLSPSSVAAQEPDGCVPDAPGPRLAAEGVDR